MLEGIIFYKSLLQYSFKNNFTLCDYNLESLQ